MRDEAEEHEAIGHVPQWSLLGSIIAGEPVEEPEDNDDEIKRIEDLVPDIRPGDFFLMVQGDSMIEAGLAPGQYVVIRPEMPKHDGEICAVWVDGLGATLKRVYADDGMVRLVPANPKYSPMTYPAEQVRIQGVLVAGVAITRFGR